MRRPRIVFSAVLRFVTRQSDENCQKPSGDVVHVKYRGRSPIGDFFHSQI